MQLSNMFRATILKGLPHENSMLMEFRLFSHAIVDADFWAYFLFICNNDIEKQKYRNTLKGKENKKSKWILLISNVRNTNLQYHCLQLTAKRDNNYFKLIFLLSIEFLNYLYIGYS